MSRELWAAMAATDSVSLGFGQKAVRLARERGLKPCAIMVCEDLDSSALEVLAKSGMEKLYLLETNPCDVALESAVIEGISSLARQHSPEVLLFEYSLLFSAVAPAVAVRLNCGITADCTALEWDERVGLLQIRPTFGGRKLAVNTSLKTPSLATVRRGIFPSELSGDSVGEIELVRVRHEQLKPRFKTLEKLENELTESDLIGAETIFSGGLGMGGKENFARLFILGRRMGAAVGASRAAVAAGYASYNLQVGQTGLTVRPKLYVAFGISGAVQHLSGMMESSKIVAVNSDPTAPIHKYSDYSVITDCNKVIDYLIKNTEEGKFENGEI